MNSRLSPPILQSLAIACLASGASEVVDLYELKEKHGIEVADDFFRQILGRYL